MLAPVLTATTVAGNTYAWTITGGTITSGASTSAATVTWNSTGPYKLKIAESNGGNCTSDSITSITVKVYAPAKATWAIIKPALILILCTAALMVAIVYARSI